MIRLPCTEEEIEALRYEHFHYPHPRVQMNSLFAPSNLVMYLTFFYPDGSQAKV
ncbi:MAG: hypothetical protein M1600_10610 [Firmicutes bacterium]|nr:hypothetical protein [Bacillota bacterium]